MNLMALGVNHKSAPIEIREKLAISGDSSAYIIQELVKSSQIDEAVLISTCNRTELYLGGNSVLPVIRWLRRNQDMSKDELSNYTYSYAHASAVKHLMRVASGLDSMVIGEAEILGQIKSSYNNSFEVGGIGKLLSRLFQNTFAVAKEVRTNTSIGISPVSVAYIAVSLSKQIFSDLSNKKVMIIGAGDTARLILKHLLQLGIKQVYIVNRNLDRANQLANDVDADIRCFTLEQIPEILHHSDIILSSTASPLPILGKGLVERVMKQRKHKPLYMVDVAVPRDIEPEVGTLADVYLYCIDDLQQMSEKNQRSRADAVEHAEIIIERHANEFMGWFSAQQSLATLRAFREKFTNIKDQTVQTALMQLKSNQDPEQVLQNMARVMLNKLMHDPTLKLREASFNQDREFLAVITRLFNL